MSAAVAVLPEAPEVSFSFDDMFQTKIATLSVRDANFARRCDGLIKPEYFDSMAEGIIVSMAQEYFERYRELPKSNSVWAQLIKEALRDKLFRKEMLPDIKNKLISLLKSPVSDRDFVVDKISEFARHQAVQEASLQGMDLLDKRDYSQYQKIMEDAFRVGAQDDIHDLDYWNEDQIKARSKLRHDISKGLIPKNGIKTGIKKIDNLLYHEGWGREEVSVLMAGAKRGKSMGLGFFAGRSSMLGYNVLYLTLEVSTSIIADREDAFISDTNMSELGLKADEVADKIEGYNKKVDKPGALRIVGYPSGSLSPSQIRRTIEKYKADGLVFDLLVVDYADIMAPDNRTNDAIENSKQVWLGLRAIAQQENLACLTATQTNREGFKEATAKAEHAAEDFNKVRIADLIITINYTEEERAAGEARLYFAASRNQAGEFAISIKQDHSKMQFITSVVGVS
jgi:replicative DNA helicase